MDPNRRVVVRLPLHEIWDGDGVVESHRLRDLSQVDIAELLRTGPVRFVVANVGDKLNWVRESECFDFWKSEVRQRLFDPRKGTFDIDQVPGGYGYSATEWSVTTGPRIVLLEMAH